MIRKKKDHYMSERETEAAAESKRSGPGSVRIGQTFIAIEVKDCAIFCQLPTASAESLNTPCSHEKKKTKKTGHVN